MDNPFEAYKNKIGTRIAKILGESLLSGKITKAQANQIGAYVLQNIDLAKTNLELFNFVENLSKKWLIFKLMLSSTSQVGGAI